MSSRAAGDTYNQTFTKIYREAPYPGVALWEGQAAEAAVVPVGTDRLTAALKAVQKAHAAGLSVGEDLSVTSRQSGGSPALQAVRQAQALAANIRS